LPPHFGVGAAQRQLAQDGAGAGPHGRKPEAVLLQAAFEERRVDAFGRGREELDRVEAERPGLRAGDGQRVPEDEGASLRLGHQAHGQRGRIHSETSTISLIIPASGRVASGKYEMYWSKVVRCVTQGFVLTLPSCMSRTIASKS